MFVDTSGFYALADGDDQWHEDATARWNRLGTDVLRVTTSLVIAETHAPVRSRLGWREGLRFLDAVSAAVPLGLMEVVFLEWEQFQEALDLYRTLPHGVSLVDAVGIWVCKQRGLSKALAYDSDFAKARIELP